ncbi:MAG: hypothetical protein Q4D25_12245 [Bacteroidales bacterium]|nr:hypothetical protein [Bacteroidales bacterium]
MGTKHYPLLSARAILLAMLALMSWCQPALAQDERYPISDVYVESNFASIPALGEKCTQPTMKLLYGYDETLTFDNGHWEKQDGTEWDMLNTSDVFEAGNTYRYTVQLKVVAAATAYNYLVSPAGGLSVSVNNVEWTPSNYSYSEGETSVTIHSPEFVWAEPANVNYFDPTAAAGAQTKKASAILLNSSNTLLSSGWYYVDGETTISDRITVMGTVNLILADGCEFYANGGIRVAEGNTINIYAQSAGVDCGKVEAIGNSNDAAIGGNGGISQEGNGDPGENAGIINIYGGGIIANGSSIIGGGYGGDGLSYEVAEEVYENGTGGDGGNGGIISIYGGQVSASWLGGGPGGINNVDEEANSGDGTIYLSWSSNSDYIWAYEYHGTVTLLKTFMDSNSQILDAGEVSDHTAINDNSLVPTLYAYKQKEPTCTEVGYTQDCWYDVATSAFYSDADCTVPVDGNPEIPALGHRTEHVDAVPATFSTGGTFEHWHCERCGKNFEEEWCTNEIEDLHYEGGKGNSHDGYYILMPKSHTKILALDGTINTFKVYDDGGKEGDYSDMCNGNLVLTAPANKVIQLTGTVTTEIGDPESYWDYFTVYTSATAEGDMLLDQTYNETNEDPVDIGTLIGTSMTLNFVSDGSQNFAGLDLTVTLLDIVDGKVTVPELSYMREFVGPEYMWDPDATIDGVDVAVYTVCMPEDPATSESMKYYTLSSATATSLQFTEVTEPKANKPYLVTVSGSMSWSFLEDTPITLQKECDGPTAGGFKFVGTHLGLSNAEAVAKGAYILQDGNDWGQVQAATAEHPEYGDAYVPAFRAFIVPVGGGAPLRIGTDFEEGGATDIQSLQLIDKDGTENWYDLNGRRIERPTQNGIYIYNGKKVAVQ